MVSLYFSIFLLVAASNFYAQGQTCVKTYTNLAISGSDLVQVSGNSSSCCTLCSQHSGCKAYSWYNNTCWLKSDTQPLYNLTGWSTGILKPSINDTYVSAMNYTSPNFFNHFNFTTTEISGGFVKYQSQANANAMGLISVESNEQIYIGVDNKTTFPANSTTGRASVRIETKYNYNSGLFIFDIDHMPTGNGTWPAFWSYGWSWPNNGEIDIIEGINNRNFDNIALHTNDSCSLPANDSIFFTGSWDVYYINSTKYLSTNCSTKSYEGGCGVKAPNNTYNTWFNQAGGGVFAMQWEPEKFIRIWIFPRSNVPSDININSSNPNPDTWGMPTAYIRIGPDCPSYHFNVQHFVINTDLCGMGNQIFPGNAAQRQTECQNFVNTQPSAFSDAFWLINYFKVYCKPGESCIANPTADTP